MVRVCIVCASFVLSTHGVHHVCSVLRVLIVRQCELTVCPVRHCPRSCQSILSFYSVRSVCLVVCMRWVTSVLSVC